MPLGSARARSVEGHNYDNTRNLCIRIMEFNYARGLMPMELHGLAAAGGRGSLGDYTVSFIWRL